ncbi:hypothetical protein H0H93_010489, partial [Arthromyces matolae]
MASNSSMAFLRRPRFILALIFITIGIFTFLPWESGLSSAKNFTDSWSPHTSTSISTGKRPNGVIFMLFPPSRVQQATLALRNVEDRFNRRLKYPYVLFMVEGEVDEVTEVQKERIAHITEGRATFAEVPLSQWNTPDFLDESRVKASSEKLGYGWYLTCLPGLTYHLPISGFRTDIVLCVDGTPSSLSPPRAPTANHQIWYRSPGFVQVAYDAEWVQLSLASNVSAFMSKHAKEFPPDANHGFVWHGSEGIEKAMRGEAGNPEWTKRCMYNNFEISHRSVWSHPIYKRFFEFLDRAGGFFYERWGDSPIHSFGVAMTLRKDQVVQFKDMG